MRAQVFGPVLGAVVVTAYATLLALDGLVFDPLAAVPGATLGQIHHRVEAIGMDVGQDVVGVLVTAGVGVTLAAFFAVVAIRGRMPVPVAAVCHLALLTFGAVAVFQSGFFLGMDVADAYGVSGGSHSAFSGVLYGTSLAALVAIPVVLLATLFRSLGRARAAHPRAPSSGDGSAQQAE
ncbi:hypothetical protein DEJ13_16070 [Curtobacterium sp. MCLR17_007]|uniref:hypothetical protein n=1 Tax=unclassified Curtobacterium TaxID=257496 RepID=UPI0006FD8A69|nr:MULTISPECIES: hypothetical protein [unclassified Curtobacterium]KQS10163.1 hypothetical protein ASG04_06225 [Curtobacterium sp. Leaf183]WIB59933.1 hypothetical protein DEJ13_16070 [Curtobacterium sp. MCLR17_007]